MLLIIWQLQVINDETIGVSYSFSNYQFYTLFGMVNDMHIRVIQWSDVWGGIKLEAHSNNRLGLKDYGSNIKLIKSLYEHVENKTQGVNRSMLLWEHSQLPNLSEN